MSYMMEHGLLYWSSATVLALLGALLVRIFTVFWLKPLQLKRCFETQGIKGPPYRFFYGNLPEIAATIARAQSTRMAPNSHDIVSRVYPHVYCWSKTYGKNFVFWVGNAARLCITSPELAKEILMDRNGIFGLKVRHPNPLARMIIGEGIVSLTGDDWARHRKILNPAFHLDRLKGMIPAMAESCAIMLGAWRKTGLDNAADVDVYREFRRLTQDIFSRTAFGNSYEEGKHILDLQGQQFVVSLQLFRSAYIPGFRFLPTKINRHTKRLEQELRRCLKDVILSRDKNNKKDLLGLMLEANEIQGEDGFHKKHMALEEIIDECKIFYIAGYETTSELLSWTTFLLAMHQDWQEKARQEVLKVCGKDVYPDADNISRLHIVGMILNEALRLYPPALFLLRETSKSATLGDWFIPVGTQLMVPIVMLHHDPEFWGEDAKEFNPERFKDGIANAAKHPMAFLPFGFGPRICIGQNFALIEAKVVLAMILQRFCFSLSPSHIHSPANFLTLQPQHGIQVVLTMI